MAAHTQAVRLLAPAKLTLRLQIVGVRSDGYHLIDAEMVTLDLCDEIIVYPSSQSSAEIVPVPVVPDGLGAKPDWDIPADGSNLVLRALRLAGRTAHIEVRKRIPPGAGLGGGSADAAAVLRWANRLAAAEAAPTAGPASGHQSRGLSSAATTAEGLVDGDRPWGRGARRHITPLDAATLGADVAFCLIGGRARVTGIGETVEPLPFRDQSFVLWTPPQHVDTAAVYRTWDELDGPVGERSNDLEPAALAFCPELAVWRDALAAQSGRTPQLAGSGGTWFVAAPFGRRVAPPASDGVIAAEARTIGRL